MFSNKIKLFVFLIVAIFTIENSVAQLSKTHFIPPLTNAEFGNTGPENQYIYISTLNPTDEGWDGFFNGEHLPSTDYWFSVELIDLNGKTRIKKGHFSLIRR